MLKAGFYEKEITPRMGSYIPGYFSERYAEDVLDRLYGKAAVINDGENEVAVLALDALDLNGEIHEAVTKRVFERTGIKPEKVLLCATHTHTGPPMRIQADKHLHFRDIKWEDRVYLETLYDYLADCVELAKNRIEDTNVKYALGEENTISFVRNFKMKDGTIRTNPGIGNPDIVEAFGEIDPDVSILYFENEAQKPVGAIINFACHLDCVGGTKLSGDYASILSKELKKSYGEDFITVFLTGACGNVNHIDVHSKDKNINQKHISMGVKLAEEVKRALVNGEYLSELTVDSKKEKVGLKRRSFDEETLKECRETLEMAKGATRTFNFSNPGDIGTKAISAQAVLEMAKLSDEEIDVNIQVIRVGDCYIYALPGEVFNQFGIYIKQNSPSQKNMVAELSNGGSHGYIPVKEVWGSELMYEVQPVSCRVDVNGGGYTMSEKALELAGRLEKSLKMK